MPPATATTSPAPHSCPVCDGRLGAPALRGNDRLLSLPGAFDVRECERCGLAVTDPRLSGQDLARHYPRSYEPYQEHGVSAAAKAIARMRDVHMFLRLMRPGLAELVARPPGRLLDVGCGRGELASAFVRRGWSACGVDPSPDAVRVACALGIDAREGTLDDVAWDPASFDAVVLHHSLEHVPDPVATLRRAGELLRPGGRLFVAVPYWGCWQRRRFGSRWFHLDVPRHLQHFDERSLETAVRAAGLIPRRAWVVISTIGLLGSLQYAAFGRCVFAGALTLPAQVVSIVLRPVTVAVGRLLGGDCLDLVAERRAGA